MTASRDRFALAARKYFRSYISMHSWRRLLIAMSAKVFLTRFRYYSQVRGIHRALYSLVLDVSQKTKQAIAHAPRSHWSGQLQSESEEWLGVARQYIRLYDSYTQSATSVKKQKAELHTQLRTDIDYLQSTSRSSLSVGNNNSGHGLPTTSGLGSPGLHPSGMPGLPQAMTHRRASLVQEEEALKRTLAKIQDPALWNHIGMYILSFLSHLCIYLYLSPHLYILCVFGSLSMLIYWVAFLCSSPIPLYFTPLHFTSLHSLGIFS